MLRSIPSGIFQGNKVNIIGNGAADYYTTPQGNYAVRCQIIEKDTTVLDLTLAAPSREAAQAMCHSWAKKSQDIYGMLMGELI